MSEPLDLIITCLLLFLAVLTAIVLGMFIYFVLRRQLTIRRRRKIARQVFAGKMHAAAPKPLSKNEIEAFRERVRQKRAR